MRGSRLIGSGWMIEMREDTTRRLAPAALGGALNALRTASSMPNRRNAASTDRSVKIVRVLRRNSAAQIRWKYFMRNLASVFLRPFVGEKVPKADESFSVEPACSSCPLPRTGEETQLRQRRLLDQRALVQMQRVPRVLGRFRIVRDHD